MPTKLNRDAFRRLIAEDIAWLEAQPRTLEREHILLALQESEKFHYDLPDLLQKVIEHDKRYRNPHKAGVGELPIDVLEEIRAWVDQLTGPRGG